MAIEQPDAHEPGTTSTPGTSLPGAGTTLDAPLAGLACEFQILQSLLREHPAGVSDPRVEQALVRVGECLTALTGDAGAPGRDNTSVTVGASPASADTGPAQRLTVTRGELLELAQTLLRARDEVHRATVMLREMISSRSWRLTRPLRAVVERMRRRKAGVGILAGPSEDARPEAHPVSPEHWVTRSGLTVLQWAMPAQQAGMPDIYLWGVIDWHFRIQRPQHLARALAARGHRVFYVSDSFVDQPLGGFSMEPLDQAGRLYQVHLYLTARPPIYHAPPTPEQVAQLDEGLGQLAALHGGRDSISIIQHSYWTKLANRAPVTRIVYDCLDHHAGFADNFAGILAEEKDLLQRSDLVVATSQWLMHELPVDERRMALIRNAGEYGFFSHKPENVFSDPQGRKVIGYYGAIEAWLDVELVRAVARHFPQHLLLLIGRDNVGIADALADLPNVSCHPEVPYTQLPYWLHGFDVCTLPFKVLPLTLATNPVKVYEYLSAGKAVVVVDLPEMTQFAGLVRIASTSAAFIDAVGDVLAAPQPPSVVHERQAFAALQTWEHRVDQFETAFAQIDMPRVSVIVVTYGNLRFTRNCLQSLEQFSDWPGLEVIVVDNASQDGTPAFLESWAASGEARKVILNRDNVGFAAANNQGLAAATGDYLILLNNDTFVTRGWIRGLLDHLRGDPGIGLVGPVTNNIGNQARIPIDYADMEQMAERSRQYTLQHWGGGFDIPTLAFFCVAMSRTTFETVGWLDEDFGIGFFEDDDYCRRIEQAGLRCVCAEDVFVHHHLSASFDEIKADARAALFERNKRIYERKWGAWRPHVYR